MPLLIAAFLAAAIAPLAAQQTSSTQGTISIVTDLAPGDLLNIRATASAFGVVLGRLPNGANLKNFGCSDVGGYKWCKVEEIGNETLAGWAPARYVHTPGADDPLLEVNLGSAETAWQEPAAPAAATEQAAAPDAVSAEAAPEIALGANGDNIFVPGKAPDDEETRLAAVDAKPTIDAVADMPPPAPVQAETTVDAKAAKPAAQPSITVPADLSARFGGTADTSSDGDPEQKSADAARQAATEDAYRLAYAAREKSASTSGIPGTPPADEAQSEDAHIVLPTSPALIPTPRPEPVATALAETITGTGTDIAVQAKPLDATANTAFDLTGEIPCARYVGQPMTRCEAGIKRIADGAADVTVTWPDGGTRIVSFKQGKPAGANSRGEFRFTREGDLNMIRIGISERFEIPDSLPLGD